MLDTIDADLELKERFTFSALYKVINISWIYYFIFNYSYN